MVKLKDGVVIVSVDDQRIVVDTDTGKYLAPNVTGLQMMEAIASGRSETECVSGLQTMFGEDAQVIRRDFAEFQERLIELDLAAPL